VEGALRAIVCDRLADGNCWNCILMRSKPLDIGRRVAHLRANCGNFVSSIVSRCSSRSLSTRFLFMHVEYKFTRA